MADVARLAGVSVTTVSHVINGTRPASQRTRDRVLAAIERTGYRPNTIARALARGGTQSLGLAISGLSNPYFMDVVAAVEQAAGRAGHTLLLGDTREDPEHELRIVRALAERQVDGMLLAPTRRRASSTRCPTSSHQGVPVVLLDRFVDARARPGRLRQRAADRAARRAPDRPSATRGSRWRSASPGLSTTDERVRGYRMALEQGGLAFDPALVAEGGSAARPGAREAMHALLDLPDPPTAVVSGNNFMTIGLLRAIAERGLTRPRRHRARRVRRLRVGRPVRAAADRHPPADDRARLARRRAAALAPRGSGPPAAHRAAGGDVRAPRLMWVHRTFTCCRFARNPEGMTTHLVSSASPPCCSIYVGARAGARSRARRAGSCGRPAGRRDAASSGSAKSRRPIAAYPSRDVPLVQPHLLRVRGAARDEQLELHRIDVRGRARRTRSARCPTPVPCASGSTASMPELGRRRRRADDAHAADDGSPSSRATAISPGGDQLPDRSGVGPLSSRLPDAGLAARRRRR